LNGTFCAVLNHDVVGENEMFFFRFGEAGFKFASHVDPHAFGCCPVGPYQIHRYNIRN
jgi:hypothetical protein